MIDDDDVANAVTPTASEAGAEILTWGCAPADCCFDESLRKTSECGHCGNRFKRSVVDAVVEKATKIQSVVLSKKTFPKMSDARKWITEHQFHAKKVDETPDSWRFRQFPPTNCKPNTFRSITLKAGVTGVICVPKGEKTPPGLK